jgi:hypothetical protein
MYLRGKIDQIRFHKVTRFPLNLSLLEGTKISPGESASRLFERLPRVLLLYLAESL